MAFSATGGTKTTDGDYTVHKFTTSGSLVCTETAHGEVLVVGGGGASTNDTYDGGGGAGELITHSWYLLSGTMTVTIGNGGTTGQNNGQDTVFGGITALGGGHGMGTTANGHSGGSGGGGGGQGSGHTGGAATEGTLDSGTSYRGAGKTSLSNESGGGGGAGASGGSGHDGCAGIDSDIVHRGDDVGYAGGGGGWPNGSTASHGGGTYTQAGTANTGGGGGVAMGGGSGIVVVRYLTAGDPVNSTGEGGVTLAPVTVSGSGAVYQPYAETTDGDYTVLTYSTPGQGRFHSPIGWTAAMTAEVLVVAGGGGGGTSSYQSGGGGGGAGGYLTDAALASIADHEPVTIGAGGATGVNGTDSVFKSLQSYGGGFGAGVTGDAGSGGAGGGLGATASGDGSPGVGTVGQGHDGAASSIIDGSQYGSGGSGGGATSDGTQGSYSTQPTISPATSGGAGATNDISGSSLTYAVGGGGGQGGGSSVAGAAGTDGRGNGGAGGQGGGVGGKGGNGVVVIRFYTPKNEMYVTLGSVRATGSGHVSAAYTGIGTSTLGVVRVAGSGTNPTYGSGRLTLGPVRIPLGISADTLYLRGDVRIYIGMQAGNLVTGLAANCTISVGGEEDMAWLRDTGEIISLEADAVIRVAERGDTLLNTGSLPATDALGWTVPDRDTPALRGLVVTLGGKRVQKNLIKDLTIDLSDRGGYDRATLVLDKSVRVGQAAMLSTLRVTYKSTVLFRGRLEARGPALGHDMQHALTFTGPIVKLKDHRGFRRVYADSDLSSWQTGQGPNTSANVFEVEGS